MRTARSIFTVALLLAVTVACTASPSTSSSRPTSSTEAPQPFVSASPTPSPTDPKVLASEHAGETVQDYYALVDQVGADGDAPLARLERVATSVELEVLRADLQQWRSDGWRKTGRTRLAEVVVQTVSLDNTDPAAGVVPTVQVDVCYDVNNVDILDSAGESVVSPDRASRGWERLQVANYDYADDPTGGWRVAALEALEKAPCAGS